MHDITPDYKSQFSLIHTPSSSPDDKQDQDSNPNKRKAFECLHPNCGKAFKFRSELNRHLVIHSGQRPFSCTFPGCNKSFKRDDALTNHLRIHTQKTPFYCSIEGCESQFTSKAALRYHLLKHKGEKAFKCSYEGCEKVFLTYTQLKQHEKSSYCHQRVSKTSTNITEVNSVSDKESIDMIDYVGEKQFLSSYISEKNQFSGANESFTPNLQEMLKNVSSPNQVESYLDNWSRELSKQFEKIVPIANDEIKIEESHLHDKNYVQSDLKSMLVHIKEENEELRKKIKVATDSINDKFHVNPQIKRPFNVAPIFSGPEFDFFKEPDESPYFSNSFLDKFD